MFKIYDGRKEFYQWDLNRKLIVKDTSVQQVHFCNRTGDCSLVRYPYEVNGVYLVDVPNVILQRDWRINVYGYDRDYTRHSAQFDVKTRTKPENYVYTDEEVHYWEEMDERIRQLEENGVSDEMVANAVEKYLEENDIDVDLTGYATETYVDEAIAAIELTPGPAGPKGEDGASGADGKDGVDGKDYVLTDADKTAIAQLAIELMPVAEEGAY